MAVSQEDRDLRIFEELIYMSCSGSVNGIQ